ncbi:hypothetical protein ONZ45_g9889 [Pleurotus djamor]|nr:hypothetical protein ONZ45_g9889 [Pleurotus djamor]
MPAVGADPPVVTSIHTAIPTIIPQTGSHFPQVGSVPRDFSAKGLERLWDIVGPVEQLPFTTTVLPSTPIALPSSPPPLYPEWFAPAPRSIFPELKLPPDFKFGVATAAYQVEGAIKLDADIVDLHYLLYKEDVARISALGINAHSFSVSWSRVLPFGTSGSPVNDLALRHYSDVVDYHLVNGVEPVVTLFHWDTPLSLVAYYGGFTSPKIVDDFVHMNISGEIAFKNDDYVGMPWRTNSSEDHAAVERHAAFQIGIFSDPVYTTGDWPALVKATLPPSILPRFTKQEQEDILGTADFYAIDAYRTQWTSAPPEGIDSCIQDVSHPLWPGCNTPVLFDSHAGWAAGPSPDPLSGWLQATPGFLRDSLKELQKRWPTNKIYISEFGFVEPFENERSELFQIAEDVTRSNYFMTYLGEVLLAIHEDKLPIAGTFAWGEFLHDSSILPMVTVVWDIYES